MGFLKNLKIAQKLAFGFGIVLALMIVIGAVSYLQLEEMNKCLMRISTRNINNIRASSDIDTNTSDIRVAQLAHILADTDPEMDQLERTIADVLKQIDVNEKSYEQTMYDDKEDKALY